jgi:hypothetical protein
MRLDAWRLQNTQTFTRHDTLNLTVFFDDAIQYTLLA